jgi:hypothetical protein
VDDAETKIKKWGVVGFCVIGGQQIVERKGRRSMGGTEKAHTIVSLPVFVARET